MGPLQGIKIVEFAGLGPAPFCGMMLSDMGADVVRIARKNSRDPLGKFAVMNRGRATIELDLKSAEGVQMALQFIAKADSLIEGFRPGVMEKLGLSPEICLAQNPKLVYGRMTGWGQTGPLARAAGHDINYIALSGALHAIGQKNGKPTPPLNLVGDFGGGGMMLAFGVVCGILHARATRQGQVIDAAMTDGAAALMAMMYGLYSAGQWTNERGANLLDTGAHFYDTYECADKKFVAIGSIEPQFYALLLEKAELTEPALQEQMNRARWPDLKEILTRIFKTKTRDEWCALMEGTDVCFAPVLDLDEAPQHPHNAARQTFVTINGVTQPAPTPRFSHTKPEIQATKNMEEILANWK